MVAGSPETVTETLRQVIKDFRIGHLMVLCHFGNLNRETTMRNTERFARDVMPHLKDLWSEYEDHWYPSGAGKQAAATR